MGHEYVVGVMVHQHVHVVEVVRQEHMVVHVPWPPLHGSASYPPLPLDLVTCLCPIHEYIQHISPVLHVTHNGKVFKLNSEGALRYAEYVCPLVEGHC